MAELVKGTEIRTANNKMVKILDKLGEGGQGIVYRVEYDGKQKALKWYKPNAIKDHGKFYKNIVNNIEKQAPTESFLWPEDITEYYDGSFGYVMNLRPREYKEFTEFLLAKQRFSSLEAMINAALNIIAGFRALHNKGYSYQDMNDGNFFINPVNGDVLICDNDNVSEVGFSSGIAGKCRYMDPQIVMNKKTPDTYTDRFSMAVITFMILFLNHPLEGQAVVSKPVMTEMLEKKLYGESPVFILDPTDSSNRPVRGIHTNVIVRWPLFPQYVKELFVKAFDKEVMAGRTKAPIDKEWFNMFVKLKSEVIRCSCGADNIASSTESISCVRCGNVITLPYHIHTNEFDIPIFPGVKIVKCHIEDSDDYITEVGEVIRSKNDPKIWGIRNLSSVTWYLTLNDGNTKPIGQGEVIPIRKNAKFSVGSKTVEIR